MLIDKLLHPCFAVLAVGRIRLRLKLTDDHRQIDAVGVDIVIADDILNPPGNEPENIQILLHGKLLDGQRAGDVPDFGHQTFGGDPFQIQRVQIGPQIVMDPDDGALGDKLQIQGLNQLFKEHSRKALQAQGKPQRVEFFLVVGSIHGRNPRGNMPFIVDVFKRAGFLFGKNLSLERTEAFQDDRQTPVMVFIGQRSFQRQKILRGKNIGGLQIAKQIIVPGMVFLVNQLVNANHERRALPVRLGNIRNP